MVVRETKEPEVGQVVDARREAVQAVVIEIQRHQIVQ